MAEFNFHKKNLLGIEASGETASVALMCSGELVYSSFCKAQITKTLLQQIDQALHYTGLPKNELDGLCVSNGPGLFTALRVSLATTQAISLGLGLPVFTVDSLRIVAMSAKGAKQRIRVVQRAYQQKVYTASFCFKNKQLQKISPLAMVEPMHFHRSLMPADLVVGTATHWMLEQGMDPTTRQAEVDFQVRATAEGVLQHFLSLGGTSNLNQSIEPLYLQKTTAEQQLTLSQNLAKKA